MTTRTHNEFLDIPASDDEEVSDRGYDSEENVTKSKGRNVKRRRTADTQDLFGLQSDQSDEEESADEEPEDKGKSRKQAEPRDEEASEDNEAEEEEEDGYLDLTSPKPTKGKKPLLTKPVKPTKKSKSKPGVVYLSSLPPYLRPSALRSFLEQRGFAPITRVFLQPTVPNSSAPKRRSNKRKTYSDGWVEFQSKSTYVSPY